MKLSMKILLCLIVLSGCSMQLWQFPQPSRILNWTVQVELPTDMGSGTVISSSSHRSVILTAYHVVGTETNCKILYGNRLLKGTVILGNKTLDLALIRVSEKLPCAKMYFGPLVAGEKEWGAGYPMGFGKVLTSGFMGDYWPAFGLREQTASICPGDSGGGIFVLRNGEYVLVGVIDSTAVYSVGFSVIPMNTVGFFVPMEKVQTFINPANL